VFDDCGSLHLPDMARSSAFRSFSTRARRHTRVGSGWPTPPIGLPA